MKHFEMVQKARDACACLDCQGSRALGAHTIANPDRPRMTPSSCAMPTLLAHYLQHGYHEDTSRGGGRGRYES